MSAEQGNSLVYPLSSSPQHLLKVRGDLGWSLLFLPSTHDQPCLMLQFPLDVEPCSVLLYICQRPWHQYQDPLRHRCLEEPGSGLGSWIMYVYNAENAQEMQAQE